MARVRKVQVASRTTDLQLDTGRGTLMGFAVRESAGTAAVASAILRDGTSTAGDMIVPINLAADESGIVWFGPQGIPYNTGLYLDMEAGSLEAAIYIG